MWSAPHIFHNMPFYGLQAAYKPNIKAFLDFANLPAALPVCVVWAAGSWATHRRGSKTYQPPWNTQITAYLKSYWNDNLI